MRVLYTLQARREAYSGGGGGAGGGAGGSAGGSAGGRSSSSGSRGGYVSVCKREFSANYGVHLFESLTWDKWCVMSV